MNSGSVHIPVLGEEAVRHVVTDPNGVYVDATFGGGGHSRMLLEAMGRDGRLIGFDIDDEAVERGRRLEEQDGRFRMVKCNFADLRARLAEMGVDRVDGVVFDLGLSTHQLLSADRGFSYRHEAAPLDMRMNRDCHTTAADFLNSSSREKLSRTFRRYGGISDPSRLVNNISQFRKQYGSIDTVGDLLAIIEKSWNGRDDCIRFIRRCFQSIRIEVNGEMAVLEHALESLPQLLKPSGVVVIITFHSLEDEKIREWKSRYCDRINVPDYGKNVPNQFSLITRGCIFPSNLEKMDN